MLGVKPEGKLKTTIIFNFYSAAAVSDSRIHNMRLLTRGF